MSISSKFSHALKDAFSFAVHQESADDFARKPYVVAAIIENSKSVQNTASPGYEERLAGLLSQVRTKHLDVLQKKGVAVGLDKRFTEQAQERVNERAIEGAYYPAKDGENGVALLWDNGRQPKGGFFTQDAASYGVTFIEKLARRLSQGEPQEPLYASRLTTIDAAGGMGLVAIVTSTDWETEKELGTAKTRAAAFTQRPAKPLAPKPN
ncbi:MAG TPA: hypothetical protein VEF76_09740 [Patescibacteria group bacterium]|nr:hypothetical protein [Patescibacteria group bacterium]